MRNKLLPLTLFLNLYLGFGVTGQTFQNYLKALNSYVAVAPESGQLMRAIDFPVNLFTGTANVALPIYNVRGIGLSVPISLSYSGAGGIRIDEIAPETGLGWSLSLGGEITREIRGTADEGSGASSRII